MLKVIESIRAVACAVVGLAIALRALAAGSVSAAPSSVVKSVPSAAQSPQANAVSAVKNAALPGAASPAGTELAIAKAALRDGLWSIARRHAEKVETDEAKLVIVESLAREGDWEGLIKRLVSWGNPAEDAFLYYRALAFCETGGTQRALHILDEAQFTVPDYVTMAARLKARMATDAGDPGRALKILRAAGIAEADVPTRMMTAELMVQTGDTRGAERIWRTVVTDTNSSVRAFTVAMVNLARREAAEGRFADATTSARAAYARSEGGELRRLAGLVLGEILVHEAKTLDEGAKLIRTLAKDAPDAPGARTAFVRLADAYLANDRNAEAAAVYAEAVETWPETAKDSAVAEGRGWALSRLGRCEEACAAFRRAEETATNEVDKAMALLKQGDVLAEAGRGDEAMKRYRQVIERYPKSAVSERLRALVAVRELEDRGRQAYRDYRFDDARRMFGEVAAADPARRTRMDYFEVLCLYGLGLDDEAWEKARTICETGKDAVIRAEATLWLAKFDYNRSQWADALRRFTSYADMVPKGAEAPSALVWAARAAFAANDFHQAILIATRLAERYPNVAACAGAYLVQGEALIELARFDEAVLVLERVALVPGAGAEERLRAAVTKADALFAMGADNPVRYQAALEGYRAVCAGADITPSVRLSLAFKIGRTLEKLKRMEEAIDQYYTQVVMAYREARLSGVSFDDEARAAFSRAAFRLADEYESRGKNAQAAHVLELVKTGGVPAAKEAERRMARLQQKGNGL